MTADCAVFMAEKEAGRGLFRKSEKGIFFFPCIGYNGERNKLIFHIQEEYKPC